MEEKASWESLHKRAKTLESQLERKIQLLSSLSREHSANFVCDEESPLTRADEHGLGMEIERDLGDLYECVQLMRRTNGGALSSQQEVWIKRYYEVHFDYSNDFKATLEMLQRKREHSELMGQTRNGTDENKDSSVGKLLREKMSIASAMRSVNEVIGQALEAKNTLSSQRNSMNSSTGGLNSISASLPSLGKIIETIQSKRSKETTVIALTIGILICFTIWWTLLRN